MQLDPEALESCLEGVSYLVTWEISNWSTQLGSNIRHSLHKRAARAYARRHFAEHGRLPEGTHHVVLSVGPTHKKGDADIEHPFGSFLYDDDRRFEADITFPTAPPAAP